jgi:nitrite reductase/ring-hydroxylating ferredoxin subunit
MLVLLLESLQTAYQTVPLHSTKRIVIDKKAFCLVHTKQGFVLIDDQCPHLGESLSKGKVNYLGEIVCPWHNFRFSLSNGEETSHKPCRKLRFYPLLVQENSLYVELY